MTKMRKLAMGCVAVLIVGVGVGDTASAGIATIQCASGVAVGPACWFLGRQGESCDTVCAAAGLVYHQATRTFAGSNGNEANCADVLNALGVTKTVLPDSCNGIGLGCTSTPKDGFSHRCTSPTTSDSSIAQVERACACRAPGVAPAPVLGPLALLVLVAMIPWLATHRLRRA